MSFILEGTYSRDVELLNSNLTLETMKTIDDSKVGSNVWTSAQYVKQIGSFKKLVAFGSCSVPVCKINNVWQFMTLVGLNTYSTSLISSDKQGIIVPKEGVYLITLTVFETSKTLITAYSIQKKELDIAAVVSTCVNNTGDNFNTQCHRIIFLSANTEIAIRVLQNNNCVGLGTSFWCLQLLDTT